MNSTPFTATTVQPLITVRRSGESASSGAPQSIQPGRVPRTETLLRIEDVVRRTGFKKSKLYVLAKEEPLLRPVRISARCVAWPESRIAAYIAKVIEDSDLLTSDAPAT